MNMVKVKKLEWRVLYTNDTDIADSIIGTYYVFNGQYRPPGSFAGIKAENPKAAAQADYEARILSALEP